MWKAAAAFAALIIAVSVASSHAFAKSGGGNGGTGKGAATSQVNKPATTAKTTAAKKPSKLMLNSVKGVHYKDGPL
jgi:hypothetical protein